MRHPRKTPRFDCHRCFQDPNQANSAITSLLLGYPTVKVPSLPDPLFRGFLLQMPFHLHSVLPGQLHFIGGSRNCHSFVILRLQEVNAYFRRYKSPAIRVLTRILCRFRHLPPPNISLANVLSRPHTVHCCYISQWPDPRVVFGDRKRPKGTSFWGPAFVYQDRLTGASSCLFQILCSLGRGLVRQFEQAASNSRFTCTRAAEWRSRKFARNLQQSSQKGPRAD